MGAVLIAEDDWIIRRDMAEILREEGYEVLEASNGAEALALLEQHEAVCLILLDLMMPVMDGWEFRHRQRTRPNCADVPVLLVSGATQLPDQARVLQAAGYLTKPFDLKNLLEAVSAHC